MNFWNKLKKPFFALAPMEDVTDVVFREIVTKAGKPDIFFTEFLNVEAFGTKGEKKVIHRLKFKKNEHPIVAQVWGLKPEKYKTGIKIIKELGFDGVDINMACPQKKIIKHGACGGLIKNQELAEEIILASKEACGKDFPLSIKTRLGFNKPQVDEWISFLLKFDLAALTIHGRTVKEMSDVPANWEEIGKAVQLRNKMKSKTLIIGNGDIKSIQQGEEMCKRYSIDGVMIGRGIFNNLFVFKEKNFSELTPESKAKWALKHLDLYEKTWDKTGEKIFSAMKKFLRIYIMGYDGASDVRQKLMDCRNYDETRKILNSIIDPH